MYSIYANDVCIYNDAFLLDNQKLVNPKLEMSDNGAGSLKFKMPTTNIGYGLIERLTTDIIVKKDGEEIWAGRVLSEDMDFYNNRTMFCEGELAFFNDTIQPPAEYHNFTIRGFLSALVDIHNSKVSENRRFSVGIVTVTDSNDSIYRYTNYETTMRCINDKLVDRLGGHLRVRKENGIRYLDYLSEYPNTNDQVIEFGVNLLDYTRNWDSSEYATVIIPLGERLEESPIEALYAYLTVADVNDGNIYVKSNDAVQEFGWIEKVVNWDDVTTPTALLRKARQYLSDLQFDDMDIELSALDLHYLNVNYEAVKLLDKIRVVSHPHGMDRYFPVTKLEIPLDSPENTAFTLGDKIKVSLTERSNSENTKIKNAIESLPKKEEILDEAKSNATQIMHQATTGFITITKDSYGSDALYVSDSRDISNSNKLWKWNVNGLGYSNDGGQTYGLAITMDGSIVADYITTGTMNANLIKTGKIQDVNQNVIFNLDSGLLTIKKGLIDLGNGNFNVDDSGYLTSKSGKISVFTINQNGLQSDTLYLTHNRLEYYYQEQNKGSFVLEQGNDKCGLAMDIYNGCNYIVWRSEDPNNNDNILKPKFAYVSHDHQTFGYDDSLNAFCNFDMHYYHLSRVTIDISTTHITSSDNSEQSLDFGWHKLYNVKLYPEKVWISDSETGTIDYMNYRGQRCYLTFKQGILIDATNIER